MSRNWIIAGVAAVCFVTGIALSHLIEPGVRVQKVTLAEQTPALEFLPAGPGPHPVALLAHGYSGSKEMLFRYGEALAAAGFVCFEPDLPGHGMSSRTWTFMETVHTLEAVASEIGQVDVFVGHSMGGFTGGEAVREGGTRPGLFIAIGSMPVLGDNAPPLLLLAGQFDEAFSPAMLKTRTDARLVISPWSDHGFESWDPVLVNAAIEDACSAVHQTPPAPPTVWLWRLLGVALAIFGAGKLASCLTDLFPRLARLRGLFIGVFIVVAFILTVGVTWIDATPHVRFFFKQGATMAVILLLAMIAGRFHIPRWSFAALATVAMVIALCWVKAGGSIAALRFLFFTMAFTPAMITGTAIGWIAARRGSRLQGDIAMAIIVGCAAFQWNEAPRMATEVPKRHIAIKLNSNNYDAFVGQYIFPPDNLYWTEIKLTIWRQGDQLVGQTQVGNTRGGAANIYPESETNFFRTVQDLQQLTFIKNEKGGVSAVIRHYPGFPDSEGKKLKNE
jgi:Alpha/beta hydrolase family